MEVIKEEPIPFYEVTCSECRSVIRYKACEVNFCHITCPICGVSVWADTVRPIMPESSKGEIYMEKKIWNIYEISDEDGGFGDAITTSCCVGSVLATDEEIQKFLKLWDKPRIYDHPYDNLMEHHVTAEEIDPVDIEVFEPYNPRTRDWPDLPRGVSSSCEWNGEAWVTPSQQKHT